MHSLHLALAIIASAATASAQSVDSQQLDFVTRLVEDAKSHAKDYLNFIQTAKTSVPAEFTSLAKEVQTYTDDSYTTLISADNINVNQLQSFATDLPWYSSRIADGAEASGSGSSGSSAGGSSSKSGSSSSSSSSASKSSSQSSAGMGAGIIVPAGATLAGLVVALL